MNSFYPKKTSEMFITKWKIWEETVVKKKANFFIKHHFTHLFKAPRIFHLNTLHSNTFAIRFGDLKKKNY